MRATSIPCFRPASSSGTQCTYAYVRLSVISFNTDSRIWTRRGQVAQICVAINSARANLDAGARRPQPCRPRSHSLCGSRPLVKMGWLGRTGWSGQDRHPDGQDAERPDHPRRLVATSQRHAGSRPAGQERPQASTQQQGGVGAQEPSNPGDGFRRVPRVALHPGIFCARRRRVCTVSTERCLACCQRCRRPEEGVCSIEKSPHLYATATDYQSCFLFLSNPPKARRTRNMSGYFDP